MSTAYKKRAGRPPSKTITKPALLRAIELVGGSTNLCLEIGIPTANGKMSEWLYTETKIPAHHVHKIVAATKGEVRPEELRPDVFVKMP
jgi:DNA-binding transcriptional regulator YdaS (Cro superfamily)